MFGVKQNTEYHKFDAINLSNLIYPKVDSSKHLNINNSWMILAIQIGVCHLAEVISTIVSNMHQSENRLCLINLYLFDNFLSSHLKLPSKVEEKYVYSLECFKCLQSWIGMKEGGNAFVYAVTCFSVDGFVFTIVIMDDSSLSRSSSFSVMSTAWSTTEQKEKGLESCVPLSGIPEWKRL